MTLLDPVLRALGRQLSGPSGPLSGLVARMLNKGNAATIAAAVGALDVRGSETVADIGFGGGRGLELLLAAVPQGHAVGVELSRDMLARARRTFAEALAAGRLTLHEAGMQSLPLADASLDGWISTNTVYFVADLDVAFGELSRVLAPGGTGVIAVADPDWMATQPVTRHHFVLRPLTEVVAALERAALRVEQRRLDGREPPMTLLVCRR